MSTHDEKIRTHRLTTERHVTSWIESRPAGGPPMFFLHGWPELAVIWRHQIEFFAERGWRCIAPDMRGYGDSSVPDDVASYSVREITNDMIELHDHVGGGPAVWIGHDWGSAVAWSIAAHHSNRCRAVINMCIPYFARGMTLSALVATVDRSLYPEDQFPAGQWDYWLHHREAFRQSADELAADVRATVSVLYRFASADAVGKLSPLASLRRNGGWFGSSRSAPLIPRDERMLTAREFEHVVAAFERTGFSGANAWYLNDALNEAYAAEAKSFGVLATPALFLHAASDSTCDTIRTRLAEPMRRDCLDLSEVTIDAGHELMRERPNETNRAIEAWLSERGTMPYGC